jgi:Txe/YoeB family toxin of Txe-Axe toxin-antitoxin module
MNPKELTHSNSLTQDMEAVLNNHLRGKEFVYRTKYGGETFGVIAEVSVTKKITWDPDTSKNFNNIVEYKNNRMYGRIPRDAKKPERIEVKNYYVGYAFSIRIKSTNNITYILDEDNIYILNDRP